MAEHWCTIHNTDFFKTAKMRTYSHPIEGTEPTEWCNEKDLEAVARLEPREPEPVPLQAGEEPMPKSKEQQIAEHVWWKELGNRIGDGSLEKDYPTKAVKIKHEYYKKMSEVTGVSFK